MENVPQVLTAPEWPALVGRLEAMGYRNKWAKLDSSRFGSAQKRVRAFMVSRLGRDPPDLPASAPHAPALCLRDIMEPERPEKFVRRIPLDRIRFRGEVPEAGKSTPSASIDGEMFYSKAMLYSSSSSSSSSPTVRAEHGKNSQTKVIDGIADGCVPVAEDTYYHHNAHRFLHSPDTKCPTIINGHQSRIKVVGGSDGGSGIKVAADWDRPERYAMANVLYDEKSQAPSLLTHGGGGREVKIIPDEPDGAVELKRDELIVNILTPRECWRLMGFPEWAFLRASRVSSETQLYNQAGNSIVVEVLISIFNAMFRPEKTVINPRLEAFA